VVYRGFSGSFFFVEKKTEKGKGEVAARGWKEMGYGFFHGVSSAGIKGGKGEWLRRRGGPRQPLTPCACSFARGKITTEEKWRASPLEEVRAEKGQGGLGRAGGEGT
jgi:hypothetical protein